MDPEIENRLKKGATFLGNLYRAGHRCASAWSIMNLGFLDNEDVNKSLERWACQCEKRTDFCKAKAQWFRLAMSDLREEVEGEYGIPFMMTAEEWDLTKLTITVEMKDIGTLAIGPKGPVIMMDLKKHMGAPEGLKTTLRVLQAFPNSRVEGVEAPAAAAPVQVDDTMPLEDIAS